MTCMKHTMTVAAAVLLAAMLTACGDENEPTPMENCLEQASAVNEDPEAIDAGMTVDAEEFCIAAREADPASFDEWYAEPRD